MSDQVPAIVLGGTGYVAGELLRLLAGHPFLRPEAVLSDSQAGGTVEAAFPHLAGCFPGLAFSGREDLARLIGGSRATMLADLAAPRSTTELAERLSLSPATVSHHITALRDAGLATARREGRSVLYARTPLGDALATGDSG